jgi:hypothetical protein
MKDGLEEVPFSCCSVKARVPCITQNNNEKRNHANKLSDTVYHKGCTGILLDKFEKKILSPAGTLLFALCGSQVNVQHLKNDNKCFGLTCNMWKRLTL